MFPPNPDQLPGKVPGLSEKKEGRWSSIS